MRARGTGPHILIVEDERAAADALRELLEDEGYVVATAADGEAALAQLDHSRPELLLTDLSLPGIDGLTLARAAASKTDCAVLLMSGAERLRLDNGGFEHIMKPLDIDELLVRLSRLSQRSA